MIETLLSASFILGIGILTIQGFFSLFNTLR